MCRVDGNRVVKVADFGLARFIAEKDYYRPIDRQRALPIMWTALESMTDEIFTTKSDVVRIRAFFCIEHRPYRLNGILLGRITCTECIDAGN